MSAARGWRWRGEGCRVGEAVGGRKRRAEWRTAGPNIAAYLRDSALAPDLGSAPALPRARRGLHGRTNKAPFDSGTCPAWGMEPGELMRPPLATTTLTRGCGLGGRTWERPAAPGSRAGARAGGGGAQVRRPGGRPTGGAGARCSRGFPHARSPAAPRRRRRQVSAICLYPGGGGGRRLAGTKEGGSRHGASLALRGGLALFRPLQLTPCPSAQLLLSSSAPSSWASALPSPCAVCTWRKDMGGPLGGCSVFF